MARIERTNQNLADLVQALREVIVFGQHAMEIAEVTILMLNTLCPQGLANFEREFCAPSTACALPSATAALSHQEKALRSTTDERCYRQGEVAVALRCCG